MFVREKKCHANHKLEKDNKVKKTIHKKKIYMLMIYV